MHEGDAMIPYGHQWIGEEDLAAVRSTLLSDWITTGPKVPEFEEALCRYTGAAHAVAVNSGTSALDIAVQALDLPPGTEVITTPFTFAATANCILYNNLVPVFADIDRETRNIDPASIEEKVTGKTGAVIFVDYAGHPCEIDEIRKIARDHDQWLIDDACHAIGASYRGRKAGTLADMTVFSFHPVKHITTGEGGAVLTGSREIHEKLQMLRSHGIDRSAQARSAAGGGWEYDIRYLGRNYRMTDFQAALGISQLRKLDTFIARRKEIAGIYREALADLTHVEVPNAKPYVSHVWHLFTLLTRGIRRDDFFRSLRGRGIGVNLHYIPVYRFTYYRERFGIPPTTFPVTEEVFSKIITIPLFPRMEDSEVDKVIRAVSAPP
jgi:UDP-4-amino-4,6-dideoxy-N-acetyl-beta-L-altrosamine transaminase